MFFVIALSLILFSSIAWWFTSRDRARLSAMAMAAAMIPIGFSMMDGVARMAPYFSLADAADFIQQQIAPNDKVIYEGPMHVGSSLLFYLGRKFYLVNQSADSEPGSKLPGAPDVFLDEQEVAQTWSGRDRIYLLVERERVQHWQAFLHSTARLPPEELITCGTTVLLSNRR
jgi:hypothetical protein